MSWPEFIVGFILGVIVGFLLNILWDWVNPDPESARLKELELKYYGS